MRRFVFDNLIYRINDNKNMLFNLTSYRRKVIDNTKLSTLINIEDKINANVLLDEYESDLLSELKKCKQILGNEVEDKVFETLKKESVIELKEYAVRAITFNLTHKCNFSCDYCYQNEYKSHSKYQGIMTIEDIKKIVSYLNLPVFNPVELEEIVISGGEPLLEKNIDTINYICNNIKTNKRTMFTNGINIIKYKINIDFT